MNPVILRCEAPCPCGCGKPCNRVAGEINEISDAARVVLRWKCQKCEQWNTRTVEQVAPAA